MKSLYEGYNIYTEFVAGSLLNDNQYNEEKSEDNYLDQLDEALEKAFPDADVEIATVVTRKQSDFVMRTSVYDANGNPDEVAAQKVKKIIQQVYDSMSWTVKK